VAVDGKALRGAYERGAKTTPLHLVNVFAVEARMALGAAQGARPQRDRGCPAGAGAFCALKAALSPPMRCIATAAFAEAVLKRGGDYAPGYQGQSRPAV